MVYLLHESKGKDMLKWLYWKIESFTYLFMQLLFLAYGIKNIIYSTDVNYFFFLSSFPWSEANFSIRKRVWDWRLPLRLFLSMRYH